jgi:hypothetical protein
MATTTMDTYPKTNDISVHDTTRTDQTEALTCLLFWWNLEHLLSDSTDQDQVLVRRLATGPRCPELQAAY